ncbi:TetR/AcrR family transcriptional regulator [Streptomyces mirabilis]|uniref:TetR/AcrR family transcriptional regulator n=1 Tax=Streptomyces mirabilis TaxID=68239 RepID=UPI0033B33D46
MEQVGAVATAKLRASRATCALYVERNATDLTVKEICARIDVSERTFYRYFPNKADVVGPFFAWTVTEFLTVLENSPVDRPLRDVLNGAFDAALGGSTAPLTSALFPLIFANEEIWSVYLRHIHDAELDLLPPLAARLSRAPESPECRAAAAAIASSTRIALETMVREGASAAATFDAMLVAFDSTPLRAAVPRPPARASTSGFNEKENKQ